MSEGVKRPGIRRIYSSGSPQSDLERAKQRIGNCSDLVLPVPEVDRYGAQTSHHYVHCIECETDVLEKDREHASHYSDCPYALDSTVESIPTRSDSPSLFSSELAAR